jgi:peptidyl-dipeptidase Dcp
MKKIILLSLCISISTYAQNKLEQKSVNAMNILTQPFKTKHQTPPFSQIKVTDYKPAIETNIQLAKSEIEAIINNKAKPTFENTIIALEFSGQLLDQASTVFLNLNGAETNDEMQKIAQELSPILTAHGNDIVLNDQLFKRVKAVYDQRLTLKLNGEQMMLLEKHYKSFARNGALLNKDQKNQLRKIDEELSLLTLKFNQNVLAETNNYELHITEENRLAGIPENAIDVAAKLAKSKNKEGWIFTLQYPSYQPVITYAKDRELRKEISLAFGSKGFQNNEFNNLENIKRIVELRHARAKLLGYKAHGNFVLEERMAKTPEKVNEFLNTLMMKAKPAAEKEFSQLASFAKETDGIDQLQKWDGAYYTEKLKQKLFNFDTEALRPYFKIENVLQGAFTVAEKLWGITFKAVKDIDIYHSEVTTYEVYDKDGRFLSVFYTDFHPRAGKRGGAWMTSFKSQYRQNGQDVRPHVANICNFTPPSDSKPALLTFDEVTTLFHEFGHGLHGMLADTTYPSLSGTSVYWDFVELPSQIMENWCYEPEALKLFAKHYETGEVIPQDFIDKIKDSKIFMQGLFTMRQLSFGMLDMAYHGQEQVIDDVKAFELNAMKSTNLYPDVAENMMSSSFSHIFAGGYSSGYYSYKWAEVLDADAFEYFKENGIFNKEIGAKFRQVLSLGGTIHPMELYKKFRGQEPNVDALLKRSGLSN